MRTVPLSVNGRKYGGLFQAIVDDVDYEAVSCLPWAPLVKKTTRGLYVRAFRSARRDGSATTFMHRVIYERAFGPIPAGLTVDHIDHGQFGGLDNRRSNLRISDHRGQAANKHKRRGCVSLFKGVARVRGASTWQATVLTVGGGYRYLGTYRTEEGAARAYDIAAVQEYGEFAKLNFPPDAAPEVTC